MTELSELASLLEQAADLAKSKFGYDALRTHQAETLAHVLGRQDCLAVMPTGSGKSLCYALPASLRPGLVLVVSPLIALIRDQVQRFAAQGLRCASLDSHQTPDEKDRVWDALEAGALQLLFVSPERLARTDFRERLKKVKVQLLAIDEAHCISQWGSHFRPDYRLLGDYRRELGDVQTLAVTATATARVREDIVRILGLKAPATVFADFARSNLKVKVIRADKVAEQRTAVLQAVLASEGSGIIYAPTRKSVAEVHRMLTDAGVKAAAYHAGMPPAERQASQRAFMTGAARVVVATNAFGMGIDKADIRFVHHAGLPGSLEQYVQEIGRAGRDGAPAQCWVIYGPRDYHIQKFMIDKSYPDVALLKDTLAEAQTFVCGAVGQSLSSLTRHLRSTVSGEDGEVGEALNVLCREGLLARWRGPGRGFDDEWAEVLISEGAGDAAALFRDYPQRKAESLAKLDAMRAFVALTGPHLPFLDEYFRR